MQPRLPNYLSAAFVACILLLAPVQAQLSLFTQGQGLSPEDNRLLFDSIARLNGAQPVRAGNSNKWSNPQSNGSGTNTVLRVFRSGRMACHLVQHHIVTGGTGRDYRLTWCRTSSGEWKITPRQPYPPPFSDGGGGATTAILPPPSTAQGNYATGCSGGSCLLFDDHWASSSLNTANWYPGVASCNNSSAQNCGSVPGPYDYAYPLSGWCWSATNGCQDFSTYDYPYGYATNSPGLTHNALAIAADGSLAFGIKLYSSTTYPTASNNVLASAPYCAGTSGFTNCNFIYWTGAAITSGGMTCNTPCYPASVNNPNAIIPVNGGVFQWRMKLDSGLQYGAYPVVECDAVGGSFAGNGTNANFEFGYTAGTGALHAVGLSVNNGPNGVVYVSTGDDGAGSGDLTNWHKFGLEWTGTSTHQWHYYIDGVELSPVVSNNEPNVPTTGWNCKLTLGIAQNQTNSSFHTLWNTVHPGPFFMYVSDAQVYKKPGT